jgi:hypothetical protein
VPSIAAADTLINLPLAALAVLAQEAPAPEHRFDLRALDLLARANPEDFDPRRPLEQPYLNALELDFGYYDFTLDDDCSDVQQLWKTLVPALTEQFLGEPVDVTVEGHELVVEGDHRAHDAARRALEIVERWLGRAWTVELAELPIGALDGLERSVLTASEVDELLVAHPPVDSTQRCATTRRSARFRRERLAPFLSDYDIEVSMGGQGATDPQIFVARWGRDAVVWLTPHVDGRVLASCIWRAGEPLGELRSWPIYGPQHAPMELAQGSGSRRVGSAWLPDGGAFLLADGGDEQLGSEHAHGPLLVRVRATEDVGSGVEDVAFLSLGAGDRPSPWSPLTHLNEPLPSGGRGVPPESLDADAASDSAPGPALGARRIDLSALLDEVRDAWASAGLVAVIERLGTEALVAGPPEALALARTLVHQRLTPLARAFSVELRVGVVPRAAAEKLTAGQTLDGAHQVFAALGERRLGSAALGDTLDLVSARTWMYLHDIDMELGPGIDLGDPIIGVVDSGTTLRARVFPRSDGRLTLGVQFHHHDVSPPPFPATVAPSLRREAPDGLITLMTQIERPECKSSGFAEVLSVTPDMWSVLSIDTTDRREGSLRVVVVKVGEARTAR